MKSVKNEHLSIKANTQDTIREIGWRIANSLQISGFAHLQKRKSAENMKTAEIDAGIPQELNPSQNFWPPAPNGPDAPQGPADRPISGFANLQNRQSPENQKTTEMDAGIAQELDPS